MITTEQIKELRDMTGISVMQCKKALEEAGGSIEKALIILRKKGSDAVAKRADRTLGAGIINSYIHGAGKVGVLVELRSETDFVSGNPEFKTLAYEIAMHIAAQSPEVISRDAVTPEMMKNLEEVFAKEAADKPEAIRAKIVQGKIDAYLKEKVLLEQPFIKNPDITVGNLIESAVQKFGEKIVLTRYCRYSMM